MNHPIGRWLFGSLLGRLALLVAFGYVAAGADLAEARRQFLAGNYSTCVALAEKSVNDWRDTEEWQLLLSQSLLMLGKYPEARTAMTNALARDSGSVRLRWLAREVFQANGDTNAAANILDELGQLVATRTWAYRDAPDLVVVGRAALLRGADPKRVFEKLFDVAKKSDPTLRDVYLARGDLTLDKHDYALAAKNFEEGLKVLPDDPDLHCGLAQAYAPSDPPLMAAALEAALSHNSNHIGSLLLLADRSIDAEEFAEARKMLDRVMAVNPWHPAAWAYRAVLAHLQNQPPAETKARQTALKFWPSNPQVDYLIGLKLSQNYRFTEGAAHQSQALLFDASYLPAKVQLAQDRLRLGEEAEGWRLAEEVQKQDGYDVTAYNLVTLHETMGKFATLTNRDFIVRMSAHEAAVYGGRVLDLLSQAKSNLCAKYGLELKRPTIVEVFPEQKDFAVRTFGMPGDPGYLGVCFGSVVTANSPATHPGHPVNWQAVLWHEFCHVVTLQMTRNKMPRWLSEGISVFEEAQANPTWGQHMNPRYREMILGDDLKPVSKLSAAFLSPPSEIYLDFAYFESSLVVEFLVQRFGLESLKGILRDLGQGIEINPAIEKHTAPMAKIEKDFAAFARQSAELLAPGLDWERPDFMKTDRTGRRGSRVQRFLDNLLTRTNSGPLSSNLIARAVRSDATWETWAPKHPTNFWVMTRLAQELTEANDWSAAQPILEQLTDLYPEFTGSESAYHLLAKAQRGLGHTKAERQVLARWAEKDATAVEAYLRLMELAAAAQEWPAVATNAERYLAVAPLTPAPHRFLGQASEHTGAAQTAIQAYNSLLQLDPPDPADVHFRLAQLLQQARDPAARRHLLQALEEAPRYRAALRLLLDMSPDLPAAKTNAPAAPTRSTP